MERLALLKDNQYPYKGIKEYRPNARAVILNDNNEIFVEYLVRDDYELFEEAEYYEIPGGGVKENEDLIDCLKREIGEECGLKIEIINEIGMIEDDYNILYRHNYSNYFLAKIIGVCPLHQEEYEKRWIKKMEFLPISKLEEIYASPHSKCATLVYNREKIIVQKVKEMLGIK